LFWSIDLDVLALCLYEIFLERQYPIPQKFLCGAKDRQYATILRQFNQFKKHYANKENATRQATLIFSLNDKII